MINKNNYKFKWLKILLVIGVVIVIFYVFLSIILILIILVIIKVIFEKKEVCGVWIINVSSNVLFSLWVINCVFC